MLTTTLRGEKRQWEQLFGELDGREWLVPGTGESVSDYYLNGRSTVGAHVLLAAGLASVDSKLPLEAASNWSIFSSSQAHNNWLMSSQNSYIPVSEY